MSTQGLSCSHEGLNGCTSLQEYRNNFTENSGDSNTGLALFDFESLFEDFKIVIIDSDIDTAVSFSKRFYDNDSTEIMTELKARLSSIDGLHIPFNEINDRLEDIWNYLTPKQFDARRAKMLIGFDVQVRNIYDFDNVAYEALLESNGQITSQAQTSH
jgi:hypothetical protein